jgi:DNA-binding transcriptional LysR family regulator
VVTRAVRELEEELGEPLFHRSTRGVQLTDFGRQLAERARTAVGGVDALFHRTDRRALSQHAGTVRVTAPGMFGRRFIPQALAPLLAAHPGLVLDLRLSEEHADVVGRADRHRRARGADARRALRGAHGGKDAAARGGGADAHRAHRRAEEPRCAGGAAAHGADRPSSGRPWPWFFSKSAGGGAVAGLRDGRHRCRMRGRAGRCWASASSSRRWPSRGCNRARWWPVLEAEAAEPWPINVYRPQRAPVPARVRLVYDELVRVLG